LLTPHITGYDNEEYNTLMEEIFAEKIIANRAEKLRQAESILMNDVPVIPVVFNQNVTVTNSKLRGETVDYYNVTQFKKAKIGSYDKYLEAGKAYITANFSDLKFTECNECAYKGFDLFKTANTIYSQYFLDEKEAAKPTSSDKK
jgi:hypothetical protein